MSNCNVENCLNKYRCRGLCSTHYKQLLKHGGIINTTAEHHGLSHTTEYRSWGQMKARCLNKKHHAYARYGGRGITVCNRWINSFSCFLEDMGNKPTVLHSIDRINVNGNYEPSNCRWATYFEQGNNTRKTKKPVVISSQVTLI